MSQLHRFPLRSEGPYPPPCPQPRAQSRGGARLRAGGCELAGSFSEGDGRLLGPRALLQGQCTGSFVQT